MIKDRYALIYDIEKGKITIFKYHDDIVANITWDKQEQKKVKSCDAQKEIEFYQFYYDIPCKNIIRI